MQWRDHARDSEDKEDVEKARADGVAYREAENIEAIVALHESVIENKAIHENATGWGSNFELNYYLKDGSTFTRSYWLRYDSINMAGEGFEDVETLENIQNSAEAITFRKSLPFVPAEENLISGSYRGFVTMEELASFRPELTEDELMSLPWGARTMTLECGLRFLTDYLDGDNYFAVHRPGHNLDRCRTQLKMVQDMEAKWDDMLRILAEEKEKLNAK